ncbi:MAG: DUF11 domain-containing protein, partial [Chloroflexi bacterium]|nr:DUF11 domain-containing protein [Chloroflexota bacterium]
LDPAIAGQMLYYTIVATNNGPSDATDVWVTDTLPTEVTFVDATEGGVYDADAHTVTWYLGDMPVGTSKTVEVHVQVNTDARIVMEGPLANAVVVMGDESDPNEANNTYVEETFVNDLADLRITKVGKPDGEVRAGEPLYYTIYVDNLGPSDARDVVVTDNILSNLEFRVSDITTSQGITRTEDGVLYFELGILPAGARATMTMIVMADETQDVNNIVSVYATTPDSDYSNNQAIVMTAITDVSDLGITKEIVGGDLIAGTNVIYEIVVWNDGPSTAENVVVKDWLPGGTVPMGEPQGLPMGAQYTLGTPGDPTDPAILNLGTLAPGERYTITLELAIDQAYGPNLLVNDVEISSDIFDPENGNNRASAVFQVDEWAELYVLKWDTPDPVMAGTTVEYF